MSALRGIRACVFDAYGTVFDFASAAARCPGIPEEQRATPQRLAAKPRFDRPLHLSAAGTYGVHR